MLHHLSRRIVAEIRLDVQDRPERSRIHEPLDLHDCRIEPVIVADGDDNASLGARRDRAFCICLGMREGLLRQYVLAGRGRLNDLRNVERVRCDQAHRIHTRIGEHLGEVRRQHDVTGGGEFRSRSRVPDHRPYNAKSPARGGGVRMPPAELAEADDCKIDHRFVRSPEEASVRGQTTFSPPSARNRRIRIQENVVCPLTIQA